MIWYNNMTKQQKKDFQKVVYVYIVGVIFIILVPMIFWLSI